MCNIPHIHRIPRLQWRTLSVVMLNIWCVFMCADYRNYTQKTLDFGVAKKKQPIHKLSRTAKTKAFLLGNTLTIYKLKETAVGFFSFFFFCRRQLWMQHVFELRRRWFVPFWWMHREHQKKHVYLTWFYFVKTKERFSFFEVKWTMKAWSIV